MWPYLNQQSEKDENSYKKMFKCRQGISIPALRNYADKVTINTKHETINHYLDCPWLKQKLRKGPFTFKDHSASMTFQKIYIPWTRL